MDNESLAPSVGKPATVIADYHDPLTKGQTGVVVSGPDDDHPDQIKVRFGGGITPGYLEGVEEWFPATALMRVRPN